MHQILVPGSDATCKLDTCTDLKSLWLQATLAPSASKGELPSTLRSRGGAGSSPGFMPECAGKDLTSSPRPAAPVIFHLWHSFATGQALNVFKRAHGAVLEEQVVVLA